MSLSKLYYTYTDPVSLGSISKLRKKSKLSPKTVHKWLASQDTYTLHAPVRKNFPRKQYYVSGPNELVQMDLADMQNVAKYNDGYRYILCAVDAFSRYATCIPVKNKTGPIIAEAITKIFKSMKIVFVHCQTDLGTEFYNQYVKQVFEKFRVNHYSVHSEIKAALVERFIRTLKEKIYKYFTAENTYRYIDVLNDLVHSYNHSIHSTIKMAPVDVNDNNVNQVWQTLYGRKSTTKTKCKLQPGDYVRVSKYKHKLEKGYLPKWSREIFIVDHCIKSSPVTYKIKDWNGDPIKGIFYIQELQRVFASKKKTYLIEKVLKRKKGWIYVKWVGYPPSMNSWVRRQSVQSVS